MNPFIKKKSKRQNLLSLQSCVRFGPITTGHLTLVQAHTPYRGRSAADDGTKWLQIHHIQRGLVCFKSLCRCRHRLIT